MHEVTQKVLKMTIKEFKAWKVPKGWKILHASGHNVYPAASGIPGYNADPYFEFTIMIEKEQ